MIFNTWVYGLFLLVTFCLCWLSPARWRLVALIAFGFYFYWYYYPIHTLFIAVYQSAGCRQPPCERTIPKQTTDMLRAAEVIIRPIVMKVRQCEWARVDRASTRYEAGCSKPALYSSTAAMWGVLALVAAGCPAAPANDGSRSQIPAVRDMWFNPTFRREDEWIGFGFARKPS